MSEPFDFFTTTGYDNGFCEFYKDPLCCVATFFCTPCTVGRVRGMLDDTGFDLVSCLCAPIGAYRNRREIQEKIKVDESQAGSTLAASLCACCAIIQDGHEVQRQLDLEKGGPSSQAVAPNTVSAPVV